MKMISDLRLQIADAVGTLKQRRDWLTARIGAKMQVGWDIVWDERERDALALVIDVVESAGRNGTYGTDGTDRRNDPGKEYDPS